MNRDRVETGFDGGAPVSGAPAWQIVARDARGSAGSGAGSEPPTAIVTLARGRRRHLERQIEAVARMRPAPDAYVVVSMDENPPLPTAVDLRGAIGAEDRPRGEQSTPSGVAVDLGGGIGAQDRPRIVHLPVPDGVPLPLAEARNAGIAEAAAGGAELVVCLDADCLPEPEMLAALLDARRQLGDGHLLAGPVGRLGPREPESGLPGDEELAASRRAAEDGPRPVPAPGEFTVEPRVELFWSLSFAVSVADHERIGGFDTGYEGYGAEDTDYAFRARAAEVDLVWVGGAWAHHQHHPISSPPVEHLAEIVVNARRFRDLWGEWPMGGWLRDFALAGLVDWDPDGTRLELVGDQPVRLGG